MASEAHRIAESPPDSLNLEADTEELRGLPPGIFLGEISEKYFCGLCKLVLYRPYQSYCGHRFCKGCLVIIRTRTEQVTCMICQEENAVGDYSDLSQCFPDNALRRELNVLAVRCPSDRCTWRGVYKQYDSHVGGCVHCVIICECGAKVNMLAKVKHRKEECPLVLIKCNFGCDTKVLRKDLAEHNTEFIGQHLVKLLTIITRLERNVHQNINLTDTKDKIQNLENMIQNLTSTINADVTSGTNDVVMSSVPETNQAVVTFPSDIDTQVTLLTSRVETLYGEIQTRMQADTHAQTELREEQAEVDRLRRTVNDLERILSIRDVTLRDLDARIEAVEHVTYDGTLTWRVSEWGRRQEDSRSGRTPSIYSPPFYTSRTGYKMCLRLYPHGDGAGRGSHVSLFFVVMRGHHDGVLPWPFRQKVTLRLMDQEGGTHHDEHFRPDPSSSSFQRPRSDMNIASGCPMFVSHSLINTPRFAKDGVVFFKVIVDIENL